MNIRLRDVGEDEYTILKNIYDMNVSPAAPIESDANELLNMTSDMLYGKVSQITEINELGHKLKEMIDTKAPYLSRALDNEGKKDYYEDKLSFVDDLVPKAKKEITIPSWMDKNNSSDEMSSEELEALEKEMEIFE